MHSDYNLVNIKYKPEINEYFKCDLKLISSDLDKSFTIESDSDIYTNYKEILNYSNVNFSEDINYLKFDNGTNNLEIKNSGLRNHNYLNNYQGIPIKINYNFIVGYKAFIEDMVLSEIQTSTVCALFHKNDLNDYNYEDFGIYKDIENNLYLSNAAIYNSGSRDESRFGICKQVNIYKSDASSVQNASYYFSRIYYNNTTPCNNQGKLNTNVVDYLKPYIGKLTFCQPHVHCFDSIDGVNIYHADGSTSIYGISNSWSDGDFKFKNKTESSKGTIPTSVLYNYPKYNMCLNTKSFLDNKSEFISTIPFD